MQHSRIGIYSINSLPTDVMFIAFFGLVGYALIKFGFEPAPLLLGFVLGKLMEENLRRALIISRGDMMTFLDHSVSAGLLAAALIVLALALLPTLRKGRDELRRVAGGACAAPDDNCTNL